MDFGSSRFSQARLPFSTSSSSSPSSSSSSNQYKTSDPSNSIIWDPHLMQFNPHKTPDQMESPPQDYDSRGNVVGVFVEKEHMFDKVVTPSDVGKLNRLVIPKQHAEKYFPLDSTTHEKGLLLNFEDRNGKSWRFRYSYWTSSQSYVMTKGWSRFVKEKRLDAGDVVSFKRGLGELEKDRFYIDWRRRLPDTTSVEQLNIFHHQRHSPIPHHFHLQQWTNPSIMRPMGVGVGLATPLSVPRDHIGQLSQTNVSHLHNPYHPNNVVTNSHGIVSFSGGSYGYGTVINPCHGGGPVYYLRSEAPSPVPPLPRSSEAEAEPIVIESVPVAHEKAAAGKRLRLFGVNMECSSDDVISSETETNLQFELYSGSRRAMPRLPSTDYFDKGKSSSSSPMSLDFGT